MFAGDGAYEPALLGAADGLAEPKNESRSSATAPVCEQVHMAKDFRFTQQKQRMRCKTTAVQASGTATYTHRVSGACVQLKHSPERSGLVLVAGDLCEEKLSDGPASERTGLPTAAIVSGLDG